MRSIPLPPKDYTIAVLVVPGAEDYGLWETASDSVVPWFQPVQLPVPGHIHPHRLVAFWTRTAVCESSKMMLSLG